MDELMIERNISCSLLCLKLCNIHFRDALELLLENI